MLAPVNPEAGAAKADSYRRLWAKFRSRRET